MRAWTWLVGAVLAVPSMQAAGAGVERYTARVTRVSDGDTVWVQPVSGGPYRKLRLVGIDAPEICQSGGEAARTALAERVLQQRVRVEERGSDTYGRGLARIEQDGEDLNAWLVRSGLAWASGGGRHGYKDQQQQARRERRGVFAEVRPEPPRDFRRRHGPCPLPPR